MAKVQIKCENGTLTVITEACGSISEMTIFPPFRVYSLGEDSIQIVGQDNQNTTISASDELTIDGSEITTAELSAGLIDGTICGGEGGGMDCCPQILIELNRILTNVVQHFGVTVDMNEVLNNVNEVVTSTNAIATTTLETLNVVAQTTTATAAAVDAIALCCAANAATLETVLEILECGANPVPRIVSVDGTVISNALDQVGSLLTINGFDFTPDFDVEFSDTEILITSIVYVSDTEIRVGVIGGSVAGLSDVTITNNFPGTVCDATTSGNTGVDLVNTVDIILEPVTWLGGGNEVSTVGASGLQKTGGGNSWNNGGAYGSKCLMSSGYFEYVIAVGGNNTFMAGLNFDPAVSENYNTIDRAVYFQGSQLRVYENGAYRTFLGAFTVPITVRVSVDVTPSGATVRYWVNGVVLYTSPANNVTFPICPDVSMFRADSAIQSATIYGIVA